MPLIQYSTKRLRGAQLKTVEQANAIIGEYSTQGYTLTLRQLYYQFVARGLIPNEQSQYKRLVNVISDGRRAGLIDWDTIEDRTRALKERAVFMTPSDLILAAAHAYCMDLWADQAYRAEVWAEKDGMLGILEVACAEHQVPYASCRGYTSDSAIHAAAQRLSAHSEAGQTPVVIQLGDHDPSGVDMTRDLVERLALFGATGVEVRRVALNMAQVEELHLPPNPTKTADSRSGAYLTAYGEHCWELDALSPRVITQLVRDELDGLLNRRRFRAAKKLQDQGRDRIRSVAKRWDRVVEVLAEDGS